MHSTANAKGMDSSCPVDFTPTICASCGNVVKKIQYQSRAADEAHTTIWSCENCPLNPSRISLSGPPPSPAIAFPRVYHRRAVSTRDSRMNRRTGGRFSIEMQIPTAAYAPRALSKTENTRIIVPVRSEDYPVAMKGYIYSLGHNRGVLAVHRSSEYLCPHTVLTRVDTYEEPRDTAQYIRERDGLVSSGVYENGMEYFVHSKFTEKGYSHSIVVSLPSGTEQSVKSGLTTVHSLISSTVKMRWMVDNASSSHIHNLSPRAWDVLGAEDGSHVYTEKIDGERCYVLVYDSCLYMFRKGAGYPLVGWRVLEKRTGLERPVIMDVENTITCGLFLIDMLTDSRGVASPSNRNMMWVLDQFQKARDMLLPLRVHLRRYHPTQRDAEVRSSEAPYPTDGVVAIRTDGTSAKKIKTEKAVELLLNSDMSMSTADGDVVVREYPRTGGVSPGDIVELKFRLHRTGRKILSKEAFKRIDKTNANSTSAVLNIMRSFKGVTRDEETRRRAVLMWCDSLRSKVISEALEQRSPKSIVLDIGTGTGQSLDVLTPDRGVSYILVEPDMRRCEMLKKRTGGGRILLDPRELLGQLKHLKSGSSVYAIMNCDIRDIIGDEEIAKLLSQEVLVTTAVFSAQYVVDSLYDISSFWSIPVVGCIYPYDNIRVGESLVSSLGVTMRRTTPTECVVQWGGDKEYVEPYTTTSEYRAFSSVFPASDVQDLPDLGMDEEAYEICSKVHVIKS